VDYIAGTSIVGLVGGVYSSEVEAEVVPPRPRLINKTHDDEKVARGQAEHENAHQAFDWCKQSPRLCQHHIAVANGRVSHP